MWEGWNKYVDNDNCKRFELLVGSEIRVLLGVHLTRRESESATQEVLVNTFSPGAGEYIVYEGTFVNYGEAELKAWEEAHAAELKMSDQLDNVEWFQYTMDTALLHFQGEVKNVRLYSDRRFCISRPASDHCYRA